MAALIMQAFGLRELVLAPWARDDPDLWAAGQNADLFEAEFGRRLVPVATEVA
jgi:hypothetical protein